MCLSFGAFPGPDEGLAYGLLQLENEGMHASVS